MAPTEVRFASPERRWDCRRGTHIVYNFIRDTMTVNS